MPGEPVYIDLHGLGPAPDTGPVWKRCWMGQEPLWRVFWGWFVCGHGAILGASVGVMILSMIAGFVSSPQSLNAGVAGMMTGATILVIATVPYVLWALVSVWRCAYNCIDQRWGHVARLSVVFYGLIILTVSINILM